MTADLCGKHRISNATFYAWKAKFSGLNVSQARKLHVLEDENAKLKKPLVEAMLDNAVLKEVRSKNWSGLPLRGTRWSASVRSSVSASVGPVQPWDSTGRRCGMRIDHRMTASCCCAYARSHSNCAALATGGSASCWHARASS